MTDRKRRFVCESVPCSAELVQINIADRGHGGAKVGLAYTVGELPNASVWDSRKIKNQDGAVVDGRSPSRDTLYDAAVDVARNLTAYGRYGGERKKALAALRRRAPGFESDVYESALDLLVAVIRAARAAVPRHTRSPEPGAYAQLDDVDFEACMREVDSHSPNVALPQKRAAVSWTILYDYLM